MSGKHSFMVLFCLAKHYIESEAYTVSTLNRMHI